MLPHFTLIFAVETCSLAESRAVTARQQLILPFLKDGIPVPSSSIVGSDPVMGRVKADEEWHFVTFRMSVHQAEHREISLVASRSLARAFLHARAPEWLEDAAYADLKKSFTRQQPLSLVFSWSGITGTLSVSATSEAPSRAARKARGCQTPCCS